VFVFVQTKATWDLVLSFDRAACRIAQRINAMAACSRKAFPLQAPSETKKPFFIEFRDCFASLVGLVRRVRQHSHPLELLHGSRRTYHDSAHCLQRVIALLRRPR
jgi:hypothetical protein